MSIFNQTWLQTTKQTTFKCGLKSKCLSDSQVREGKNLLQTLDAGGNIEVEEDVVDNNFADTIYQHLLETTVMPSAVSVISATFLNDVISIRNAIEVHEDLNATIR